MHCDECDVKRLSPNLRPLLACKPRETSVRFSVSP